MCTHTHSWTLMPTHQHSHTEAHVFSYTITHTHTLRFWNVNLSNIEELPFSYWKHKSRLLLFGPHEAAFHLPESVLSKMICSFWITCREKKPGTQSSTSVIWRWTCLLQALSIPGAVWVKNCFQVFIYYRSLKNSFCDGKEEGIPCFVLKKMCPHPHNPRALFESPVYFGKFRSCSQRSFDVYWINMFHYIMEKPFQLGHQNLLDVLGGAFCWILCLWLLICVVEFCPFKNYLKISVFFFFYFYQILAKGWASKKIDSSKKIEFTKGGDHRKKLVSPFLVFPNSIASSGSSVNRHRSSFSSAVSINGQSTTHCAQWSLALGRRVR